VRLAAVKLFLRHDVFSVLPLVQILPCCFARAGQTSPAPARGFIACGESGLKP